MRRLGQFKSALHDSPVDDGLVDVSASLKYLEPLGWDTERLAVNDLPIAAQNLEDPTHEAFWHSVAVLAAHLREIGAAPLLIKCRRVYPYCDQNVDVLLPHNMWPALHDRLEHDVWRRRGGLVRGKQRLVEPGKEKLAANTEAHVDAHLYAGISWRHQRPMDMSLRSIGEPLRGMFEWNPTNGGASEEGYLHPGGPLELVIQAAHICFENYRMTLGEAMHIGLLAREPSDFEAARELAEKFGATRALSLVIDTSRELLDRVEQIPAAHFPVQLPRPALANCFEERYRHNRAQGAPVAGGWELVTSHAFRAAAVSLRRFRRVRHGHETYGRTRRWP